MIRVQRKKRSFWTRSIGAASLSSQKRNSENLLIPFLSPISIVQQVSIDFMPSLSYSPLTSYNIKKNFKKFIFDIFCQCQDESEFFCKKGQSDRKYFTVLRLVKVFGQNGLFCVISNFAQVPIFILWAKFVWYIILISAYHSARIWMSHIEEPMSALWWVKTCAWLINYSRSSGNRNFAKSKALYIIYNIFC